MNSAEGSGRTKGRVGKAASRRGAGTFTHHGCPVEVYRRLPAGSEPDLIDRELGRPCSILDLGGGTGRIADALIDRGHRVVVVDSSAAMLRQVRRAATVCSSIEALRPPDRFDAVLLASHLINSPDIRHSSS